MDLWKGAIVNYIQIKVHLQGNNTTGYMIHVTPCKIIQNYIGVDKM